MPFAPVPALRRGDAVAVVAPSGPFDRPTFEQGVAVLARRYEPRFTDRVFAKVRYLAGPDADRLAELQQAFDAPGLSAVFQARGGYGAARLLPRFHGRARAFTGFSDGTALHAALQAQGLRSVHGPVLTQLGKQPEEVIERLFALLEGRPTAPLAATQTLVEGVAEGPLVGGNLSVLSRLLGTPWMPPVRGAVLLLEDVGERPYRLDRLWTHLAQAGALEGVAGIALGDFTDCDEKDQSLTAAEVLRSLAQETGLPCAAGFAIGHGAVNQPVVLGARVRLDATHRSLTALEGLT